MVHFAPTKKTVNSEELAKIFRTTWQRQHGIPKVIISDRDKRFLCQFWKALFKMSGTHLRFSTAFHPQTDGQSERANRTLEEVLRHFVSPRQDDWDEYLDLAEYAINDSVNPSTGYTPFFLAYGHHPSAPMDLTDQVMVPAAQSYMQTASDALQHAKTRLREAQLRQALQANKHRRDVQFKVGDQVRLSTANLRLPSTMSKKLVARYLGPFVVQEVVNPVTYRLHLPDSLKIHPVFHVSLLQPWHTDAEFPDHKDAAPPGPVVQEDDQYLVNQLLDKRRVRYGNKEIIQYLVRWEGYGPQDDTWVAASDIEDSLKQAYEATHHGQLTPTTRSTRRSTRHRL
jgi:hypothetical protein